MIIIIELFFQRIIDFLSGQGKIEKSSKLDQITILIKTFERHRVLKRLLRSIKRMYPDIQIIVVDDSKEPLEISGVIKINLSFDSGVSAGRMEGINNVRTKYTILVDDDFVFYRKTRILPLFDLMESNPQIDIIGGKVINLPFFASTDYTKARVFPTRAKSLIPPGTLISGMPVCDKVPNFYICKTESVRKIGWIKELKRVDHRDFFTRAKGKLVSVYNKDFRGFHGKTPFDKNYMKYRGDYQADIDVLRERYYRKESLGFIKN